MRPFNLEEAKKGAKVCTREGKDVVIVDYNYKCYFNDYNLLICKVIQEDGKERAMAYLQDGRKFNNIETKQDLFMKPEKHEGWVNIYREDNGDKYAKYIYESKEEAERGKQNKHLYIATTKIEWEE